MIQYRTQVNGYEVGQVVEGKKCGKFVIVGFRTVGDVDGFDCKEILPNGNTARSKMFMTFDCIK